MPKETNFYKQIFRTTSLFGSSQVLQFVFQVFSNKIIAVLLGPVGIGTLGFINNIIQMIVTVTSFDLSKTATREIALLTPSDKYKLHQTLQRHFEFALAVGIFASLISVFFAKTFSQLLFDDNSKIFWFYLLPVYFVFFVLTQTRLSILQGLREVKTYAFLQVLHVVLSGLSSITLYYFFGLNGIIWALLSSSFIQFVLSFAFTQKYFTSFKWQTKTFFDSFKDSKSMLYFGFVLSINAIVGQLCFLGIRTFLKYQPSGDELLGFYEVSQVVLIKYLGLVFVAMSYDFYPKLTAIIDDIASAKKLINQQIEIAVLIVLPAVLLFYAFAPQIIQLLYSEKFIPAFEILYFGLMALAFKAFTFPLGFYALAKGDKRQFFKQEIIADLLNLVLSISFYQYFGLAGLGLAILLNYIFYGLFVYFHLSKKYAFDLSKRNFYLLFMLIISCGMSLIFIYLNLNHWFKILLFSIVFIVSIYWLFKNLRK